MSEWILSIVGSIVLSTLIDVMLTDGETKKYVKGICSLIVFSIILAPLPNIISNDSYVGIEFENNSTETSVNVDFLYDFERRRAESIKNLCIVELKEKGIDKVEIVPVVSYLNNSVEITEIQVNAINLVITTDLDNIDIISETIIDVVSKSFSVSTNCVKVLNLYAKT